MGCYLFLAYEPHYLPSSQKAALAITIITDIVTMFWLLTTFPGAGKGPRLCCTSRDGETEAQRGVEAWPRSHSQSLCENKNPGLPTHRRARGPFLKTACSLPGWGLRVRNSCSGILVCFRGGCGWAQSHLQNGMLRVPPDQHTLPALRFILL